MTDTRKRGPGRMRRSSVRRSCAGESRVAVEEEEEEGGGCACSCLEGHGREMWLEEGG